MIAALLLYAAAAMAQGSHSLSLPARTPVYCSAQTGCTFSVYSGTTAVLIARFASFGQVAGTLGETWTLDQCVPFTGDCSFHANFATVRAPVVQDTLTFSGNQFYDVVILLYDGLWNFDAGNFGTYDAQNSAFQDCTNGQDCPYPWTLPIETDVGNLIVSWLDINQAGGSLVRPGPGYILETSDDLLFIEDQLAPVKGVYMGTFTTRRLDGAEDGGTHWLAGIAAYKKAQ